MALAALCDDSEWGRTWRDVLQHRFTGDGELAGHAVGNLLIASFWQRLEDPVAGLDWVARLLGSRGRVLPMSMQPLQIEADVQADDGTVARVVGQVEVATARGRIRSVALSPTDPTPCPEAVGAVLVHQRDPAPPRPRTAGGAGDDPRGTLPGAEPVDGQRRGGCGNVVGDAGARLA
jgi:uncharacterized cofD-like protein